MPGLKQLLIWGFGGHARSVADIALASGFQYLLFVDENAREGESFLSFPVVKDVAELYPLAGDWWAFPAAGDNCKRKDQVREIDAIGLELVTLISPTATVGAGASLGGACLVGHHAHIGPMARIGAGCIVNTSAVVEHECCVGSFSHVSVNATMAGRSQLGQLCMLGAGATIIDGCTVTDSVTLGAGAVVVANIYASGSYVGVPAKQLK